MNQSRLVSLEKLRKLREMEVDQSREYFAQSLTMERKINDIINDIKLDIEKNKDFMKKNHDYNEFLMINSSYYNWLSSSYDLILKKEYELKEAQKNTEKARQNMIEANTSLEATNKLISLIKKEIDYFEERKTQNEIDDIARNSFIHKQFHSL